MTEKTASKYLLNLEKQFAHDNPVLLQALKVFQEVDQFEYDLGLIEAEETTASKHSWWPIVSLVGGNSTAKARFINSYLETGQQLAGVQSAGHKFTVLLHNNQTNSTTLPGTALDVDPRYPFYKISSKIEQQKAGEGSRINSYLELKTLHSDRLKGKLIIDMPNVATALVTPVISLLTRHTIETSDLVCVFSDVFESDSPLAKELIGLVAAHQDTNKFVYLIDEPTANLSTTNNNAIISLWQRKLAELGLNSGQFIVLTNQQNSANPSGSGYFAEIDHRMANVAHGRSYRVLDALEKNINDIKDVVIPETQKGIAAWKDRVNMSTLMILGFLGSLAVLAEIQIGILEFIIDPIIGPMVGVAFLVVMIPIHLISSRLQGRIISHRLAARQKELHLLENLANLFEKNLTFRRMMFTVSDPVGWNKKSKARLLHLREKTEELVQSLNDHFSSYQEPPPSNGTSSFKEFP
ncbi:P-loop NTPase family protein [Methylovulum psychrotolerans]|uniref:Dynamin family protein n=1 Tax=Methylovulum psychrotolerans TaxID=1704499 RepID=A0A1Z4BZH0_9GAMM|nr:hypothetical protein [Methylovulum psychrotolerans]ASF46694.1 hypothetical protein CEK71_11750 [Methylovulum psychrotolerans]